MNKQEKEILDYLEKSYCGAKMEKDDSAMVRISRAICAFKSNPEESVEDLFTEKFIDKYIISIEEKDK